MKPTVYAVSVGALVGTAGLVGGLGACSGDDTSSNGAGGQATASHTTSQGGGGAAQGGEAPQGGGQAICGGVEGLSCGDTEWCDYQPSHCGSDDGPGVCKPRPNDCDASNVPICACNGTIRLNQCNAQAFGLDIDLLGGCEPPGVDLFTCGGGFCSRAAAYCSRTVNDVAGSDDIFRCVTLPAACGDVPTCDCLADEVCGANCTGTPDTGLVLTCPGG